MWKINTKLKFIGESCHCYTNSKIYEIKSILDGKYIITSNALPIPWTFTEAGVEFEEEK